MLCASHTSPRVLFKTSSDYASFWILTCLFSFIEQTFLVIFEDILDTLVEWCDIPLSPVPLHEMKIVATLFLLCVLLLHLRHLNTLKIYFIKSSTLVLSENAIDLDSVSSKDNIYSKSGGLTPTLNVTYTLLSDIHCLILCLFWSRNLLMLAIRRKVCAVCSV